MHGHLGESAFYDMGIEWAVHGTRRNVAQRILSSSLLPGGEGTAVLPPVCFQCTEMGLYDKALLHGDGVLVWINIRQAVVHVLRVKLTSNRVLLTEQVVPAQFLEVWV